MCISEKDVDQMLTSTISHILNGKNNAWKHARINDTSFLTRGKISKKVLFFM